MRTAVFPGSFDPFTLGHARLVERALPLFDRLVIAVGVNAQKQPLLAAEERVRRIAALYAAEPRVRVVAYDDLTVELCRREEAAYIVRGIRSVRDMEYEREVADVNRQLTGVETVLLFAEPQYASLSSSLVRELMQHGRDVSAFLP